MLINMTVSLHHIQYLPHLTIIFFNVVWNINYKNNTKTKDQINVQFLYSVLTALFHPLMQDPWSHFLPALSLCLGKKQLPDSWIRCDRAGGFPSPGFPLVTWALLLYLSPGNFVLPRAQSGWCCRAWWGVLSLLLCDPASSSLHLSVPTVSSALWCHPGL